MDSLQICRHGHAAVLHAIEFVVAKISRDSRQHAFKAPTALLRRMIVMPPSDGQEIDNAFIDGEETDL